MLDSDLTKTRQLVHAVRLCRQKMSCYRRKQDVASISAVHHSLGSIDSFAGNIRVPIDIVNPDYIAAVESHPHVELACFIAVFVVLGDGGGDVFLTRAADVVIASLYGRVRAGEARSVGLPESSARALTQLINHNVPIVSISFGNPYLLQSFPSLRTYVMAYGDMPTLQEAAARALLGKVGITGRLPISLPGLYQRGTGIQLRADIKKVR